MGVRRISEDAFGLVGMRHTHSNKSRETCFSELLLAGVRLDPYQLMIKQWQIVAMADCVAEVVAIPVAEDTKIY